MDAAGHGGPLAGDALHDVLADAMDWCEEHGWSFDSIVGDARETHRLLADERRLRVATNRKGA